MRPAVSQESCCQLPRKSAFRHIGKAAIAQLERSLIAERVRAGLRRAKADGKRLGRPRVVVDPARLEGVIRRHLSVREAARELGISASSFARLMRGRYAIGTMAGQAVPLTIHDPADRGRSRAAF